MPIQYGPSSQPLYQGSFATAFLKKPAAATNKAASVAKAPAKKPAASTAPVSQTLAQVAQQRVDAQIAPQVAAQDAFNKQQNSAITAFAQALLGKLQPIAGQVGASYDSAIAQQGALSSAAADYLKQANPSGPVAELLKSAGAPQSQIDQVSGNLGQTFTGGAGVLSFLGGTVPGSQMAANKAASVGEAAQLPGFAALKGQQDLASALWQQNQSRQELEATRPALYQAAAQDIRTNNAARQTAAATAAYRQQTAIAKAKQDNAANYFKAQTASERAHEFDVTTAAKKEQFKATQESKQAATDFLNWYKTQGLNLDTAKVNEKAKEFGVTAAQKQQALAIQQQKANAPKVFGSATSGYYAITGDGKATQITGAQGKPPKVFGSAASGYYALTPDGRVAQLVVPNKKAAGKGKTLSPEQLRTNTADITNTVKGLHDGGTDPTTNVVHPKMSKAQALQFLQDQGYLSSPQLASVAVSVLNRIYRVIPGEPTARATGR